eukprot:CAMPEP_0181083192 /NCGR_PEP_ID=MMETSP1071-20121207/4030_1 /TAXON_ID=35127 /ORGANISM="Thalassiosira sp., Strain NH16" /LENGTH=80 /DNA_ID=CAMNT_0023164841 /DNA_START=219 /DNA_END=461 /DNA_ORIENTATION=-
MPSRCDPASCHHTSHAPDTQVMEAGDQASCRHAFDSGAQVARLSGRASCLRASPSLPRHMQRSGGQAFARKRRHPSSALD